jgi:hypothetical protein
MRPRPTRSHNIQRRSQITYLALYVDMAGEVTKAIGCSLALMSTLFIWGRARVIIAQ